MKIETLSIDQKDEKAVLKTYILDDYPKYYQQQKRPAVVICPEADIRHWQEKKESQ